MCVCVLHDIVAVAVAAGKPTGGWTPPCVVPARPMWPTCASWKTAVAAKQERCTGTPDAALHAHTDGTQGVPAK